MVDAADLKSAFPKGEREFESRPGHTVFPLSHAVPRRMVASWNACAMAVAGIGCTRVGVLSLASVASVANAAVTRSEETLRHVFVMIVLTLATLRTGLRTSVPDVMIEGSRVNGSGTPVEPRPSARSSSTREAHAPPAAGRYARCSPYVDRACRHAFQPRGNDRGRHRHLAVLPPLIRIGWRRRLVWQNP